MEITWPTTMSVEQAAWLREVLMEAVGVEPFPSEGARARAAAARIAVESMPKNIAVPWPTREEENEMKKKVDALIAALTTYLESTGQPKGIAVMAEEMRRDGVPEEEIAKQAIESAYDKLAHGN